MARPPALYRVARALRRVGVVALVVLVLYAAAAAFSASQVRPDPGGGATRAQLDANGTAEVRLALNLSNPGFFAFTDLTVGVDLQLPNGTEIGRGGTPAVTVAAGSTGVVPVTFWLPVAASQGLLLTHDLTLPLRLALDLTYASLFTLHATAGQNYSWGAPLSRLNATWGAPTPLANGSYSLPVTVSFDDDADFAVAGVALLNVTSAGGSLCTQSALDLATGPYSAFQQTTPIYVPASCNLAGGELTVTYLGPGVVYAMPPERLP